MKNWTRRESPRGTRMTFPFQLHQLLSRAEELGLSHVVAWDSSGEKFIILNPAEFTQRILPSVFRQSKFSSFKRQLNAYGFVREMNSSNDMDTLIYSNENFARGNPGGCGQILRRRPGQAAAAELLPAKHRDSEGGAPSAAASLVNMTRTSNLNNKKRSSNLSSSSSSDEGDQEDEGSLDGPPRSANANPSGRELLQTLACDLTGTLSSNFTRNRDGSRGGDDDDDHILDELAASLEFPDEEMGEIKGASGIKWDPQFESLEHESNMDES